MNTFIQRQLLLLMFIFPLIGHAAVTDCTGLLNVINSLGKALQAILGAVAVIMILIAAYNYLTAGDDPQKVKKAHLTITWAVVGIAVAVIGGGLIGVVETAIGGTLPKECGI